MPKSKSKWHSMNIFLISISFLFVSALHYAFFSYEVTKNKPIQTLPQYQKVSVQMASLQKPIEKPKEVVKKPEPKKETSKKEIKELKKQKTIKKPIKKEAKRKIVKQQKKLEKKKVIKKKPEVKKVVKKQIVKEEPKKIEKKVDTKPVLTKKEPLQNVSKENKAQSLKKIKAFKQNYLTQLRAKIDSNKKYPKISKRLNEQGRVIVSFRVLKSGKFENIKILTSSGKKRLDKAALNALKETNSFKVIPQELKVDFLNIELPISFKLQ